MLCVQRVCVKDIYIGLQVNFFRVKLAQIRKKYKKRKKKSGWGTLRCLPQINQSMASDQRQPTAVHYIVKCRAEHFPLLFKRLGFNN